MLSSWPVKRLEMFSNAFAGTGSLYNLLIHPPQPPSFDIFLNFRLHIQHLSFFSFSFFKLKIVVLRVITKPVSGSFPCCYFSTSREWKPELMIQLTMDSQFSLFGFRNQTISTTLRFVGLRYKLVCAEKRRNLNTHGPEYKVQSFRSSFRV